jgi:hypothetical protein
MVVPHRIYLYNCKSEGVFDIYSRGCWIVTSYGRHSFSKNPVSIWARPNYTYSYSSFFSVNFQNEVTILYILKTSAYSFFLRFLTFVSHHTLVVDEKMSERWSIEDDTVRVDDFGVPSSCIGDDYTGKAATSLMISRSYRDYLPTKGLKSDDNKKGSADNASNLHSSSQDFSSFSEDIENDVSNVVTKKDLESVRNIKILILFAFITSLCGAGFVYYQNVQTERLAFENYFQADSSKVSLS